MAKASKIEKNRRRAEIIEKFRERRVALKLIIRDTEQDINKRIAAMLELQSLPRDSSKIRYRNRCSITGRPRGYVGLFGLSRISTRNMIASGSLPGVIKTGS